MNNTQFFLYLAVMAGTTYLVRALPFALVTKKIENSFLRSFLYYIPYAVLTVMTVPGIFYATDWMAGAIVAFVVAIVLSLRNKSLTFVAAISCVAVFLVELGCDYLLR